MSLYNNMSGFLTPTTPTTPIDYSNNINYSNNNDIANISTLPTLSIVAKSNQNFNTIILIEDVSKVRHFFAHNINGTPRFYKTNDVVYYRNKFFVAIKNTTREPFSVSIEWKEIFDVPARYDISVTEPQGLKKPGDQWENPKTSIVYTYVKNGDNRYLWMSD